MTVLNSLLPATRGQSADARYRADIDGLRALAVGLVVTYHVWFGRVSGGVDVFLMISAYFMTGSLARQLVGGRMPNLRAYWARRAVRLLPAAAVTIFGVLALALMVYPPSTWQTVWNQSWASLFYVQNWELAAVAVDYYDRDVASPLQHFWSLSIQGQVIVVWPILMGVVVALARRLGLNPHRALAVVFGALFAGSLAFSIIYTAAEQQAAYFSTFARLWEFALGSLLALIPAGVRLPPLAAAVAGWGGMIGLVSCGALLDVYGGFPGYLALWPTLSAAAVILAGRTVTFAGPTRLLSGRLLQMLGRIAYALYLVHWPVLITWLLLSERTTAGLIGGTGVIAVSLALAAAVTIYVERPAIRLGASDSRRRNTIIVASLLMVTVPLTTWQLAEWKRATDAGSNPGAQVLLPDYSGRIPGPEDEIVPYGSALDQEWAGLPAACSGELRPREAVLSESCLELRPTTEGGPLIAVVGDSHAGQWGGAFVPLAEANGWTMVSLTRGGCAFGAEEPPVPGAVDCEKWRDAVLRHLQRLGPDVVVMMGSKATPEDAGEYRIGGIETYVDRLTDAGIGVVLIRDNPRFDEDMFACIEDHGAVADECRRDVDNVLAPHNPAAGLARDEVKVVDLTAYLCPDDECLSVIGGVAVYLDDNHITATYARSLAPAMAAALGGFVERFHRQ